VTDTVPERITVTIDSPGAGAPLAADDALRQFLDLFELLTAAGGTEASPVLWKLVDISKRNPVTMIAEAVSKVPGLPIETIATRARREKERLAEAITDLTSRQRVPRWMDRSARLRAQSLFKRNSEGIGRTSIRLFDGQDRPEATIVDLNARAAVTTLQRFEESLAESKERLRTEIGSIEGYIVSLETYYGHPAVRVKERLSSEEIVCVLPDEMAESTGIEHNWNEVWKSRRVLIAGEIKYGRDGLIERLKAFRIKGVDAPVLREEGIADPSFTSGLSPYAYLSAIRRLDDA